MTDKSRKAFEAAAKEAGLSTVFVLYVDGAPGEGYYKSPVTENFWEGWKAGREQLLKELEEPTEGMLEAGCNISNCCTEMDMAIMREEWKAMLERFKEQDNGRND